MGRTLLIYANDHDDRFPETLADVQDDIDQAGDLSLAWVQENVAYLGRGMTTSNEPDDPVAYDKTLYERGGGTNVLYLDTHVAFESPERLKELGIAPDKPSPAALRSSARRLQLLGKNLLIYANYHDDTFPDALEISQSGRTPDDARDRIFQELVRIYGQRYAGRMGFEWEMGASELPWYREHVQYLGKGVKANDNPGRVLAYDKTLQAEGKGTNVLYLNSQVVFESPARLEELSNLYVEKREVSAEAQRRAMAMSYLKQLALAAIMYADEHDNTPANNLAELEPYIRSDVLLTWAKENAQYIGKGAVRGPGNKAFEMPLFYWKNPPVTMSGTAVAFFDGHVEIVDKAKLAGLGVTIRPQEDR